MRELTDIVLILDDSQSMQSIAAATREGVNAFITEQQQIKLPARMTLHKFSVPSYAIETRVYPSFRDPRTTMFSDVDMQAVRTLRDGEYRPFGYGTALRDAMGYTIEELGSKLARTPEEYRPNKVIIVTMTDGEENKSRKFSDAQLRHMIEHQREVYKWQFLYLGANQDAFKVGAGLGIPMNACMNYAADKVGTAAAFAASTGAVAHYRSAGGVAGFSK